VAGLPIDWVDAFAEGPFGGNGCAVVIDGGSLPEATCTAIVRETGLVECTFVGPAAAADFRVRYFLADREVPFAGHPTLATAAALAGRGMLAGPAVRFQTGAGVVSVEREPDGAFVMTQPAPRFGPMLDPAVVAAVGGLAAGDLAAPPQVVSTGLAFCIALVRSPAALRRLRLDHEALARFRDAAGGATGMEPFWAVLGGATAAGATFARLLLAPPSPPEDPFTGSATGALGALLWARGLVAAPRFMAEQGHWMGRPGRATVELVGPPQAITAVRVGGRAHVLVSGELRL
jgi:PhzF family phenazine biosynthesis protein